MNLDKLLKIQAELDKHIVEKKGLQGQDLLDKKILALQVELGELANEHRGFKFWSEDQEPRDFVPNPNDVCKKCNGEAIFNQDKPLKDWVNCDECDGVGVNFHNPLLEEYVDCLHFILSIGNDLNVEIDSLDLLETCSHQSITTVFSELMVMLPDCLLGHGRDDMESAHEIYDICLANFVQLGEMLGFTWEQIEQAYLDKNKKNHDRQESGY